MLKIRHHPDLPLLCGQVPGLLIKPAKFLQHVIDCPGCNSSAPRGVKRDAHPVRTFTEAPDKGFVRVLFKAEAGEKQIKLPHCPAQMPAGTGEDKEIVHVPDIIQMRLAGKEPIGCSEMKNGRQRISGRSPGYNRVTHGYRFGRRSRNRDDGGPVACDKRKNPHGLAGKRIKKLT